MSLLSTSGKTLVDCPPGFDQGVPPPKPKQRHRAATKSNNSPPAGHPNKSCNRTDDCRPLPTLTALDERVGLGRQKTVRVAVWNAFENAVPGHSLPRY